MPTKHEINRSFLSQLNEPERSEALENYDEYHFAFQAKDTAEVLRNINWTKTRQGHKYWADIHIQLLNNTYPFKTKTNQTMKHEVILNSKQLKQMTIADAPNGCYLKCNEYIVFKLNNDVILNLTGSCLANGTLALTQPCRILEPGESITINIK